MGVPFSLPSNPKLLSADKNNYPLIIAIRNPIYPMTGVAQTLITSQLSYFTVLYVE